MVLSVVCRWFSRWFCDRLFCWLNVSFVVNFTVCFVFDFGVGFVVDFVVGFVVVLVCFFCVFFYR